MWNKAELVWTAVRLIHCVGGSSSYLQLVWDILEIGKYAYKKKAGLIQFCHSDIVHWLYVCCINKNLVCAVEDWYNQYLLMWKTALPGQHCRPGDSVAACWWAAVHGHLMDVNHPCHLSFFKQDASEWSALPKHAQYVFIFITRMFPLNLIAGTSSLVL